MKNRSAAESSLARVIDALLPSAQPHLAALTAYVRVLETWNAKIDLTAARGYEALADVLIADALVMADEALVPHGAHLLDVGSGAGAPAIPLAIVRPDVRVTMLEPHGTRIAFLRTAIGTVALAPRVVALPGRLDPSKPKTSVLADITSARATFAPDVWLTMGLAIAPRVIVLTTPDEVPTAPNGRLCARRDYVWPGSRAPRALVRIDRDE